MAPTKYYRWQLARIKRALTTRRVISIVGARQCGKTTITQDLQIPSSIYRTLDDTGLLALAIDDPLNFVKHSNELMIIDEIQRAPNLLTAIKKNVDENQSFGRFLITGSANLQAIPSVKESLAGRIRNIRLRPLSVGEIYSSKPVFLERALKGTFNINAQKYDKDDYISLAFAGGYPEPLRLGNILDQREWYLDYVQAIIKHDLHDVANIRRRPELLELFSVLASWSSKYVDLSTIKSSLAIDAATIKNYISALENLFMVDSLSPWIKTDYERISKKPIYFLTDTGLMASLLRWKFDDVRVDGDRCGKLIETFIYTQLMSEIEASDIKYNIFHYRDREKREVDFIIESDDNTIIGIEVKSSASVGLNSFKHLKWFEQNNKSHTNFIGLVLYSGEHILSFGENLWAVPISSIWAH